MILDDKVEVTMNSFTSKYMGITKRKHNMSKYTKTKNDFLKKMNNK
jgi:hypothetical protein